MDKDNALHKKKAGKGTDNKIRKNLIISCLVDVVAENLNGKDVDAQKKAFKEQLEYHLSAKLLVRIIQDLHARLSPANKAEFALNLLADVQLLQNGKFPVKRGPLQLASGAVNEASARKADSETIKRSSEREGDEDESPQKKPKTKNGIDLD